MMFRGAMNRSEAHVLTGSTKADDVDRFPFRPSRVVDSIADVIALV